MPDEEADKYPEWMRPSYQGPPEEQPGGAKSYNTPEETGGEHYRTWTPPDEASPNLYREEAPPKPNALPRTRRVKWLTVILAFVLLVTGAFPVLLPLTTIIAAGVMIHNLLFTWNWFAHLNPLRRLFGWAWENFPEVAASFMTMLIWQRWNGGGLIVLWVLAGFLFADQRKD